MFSRVFSVMIAVLGGSVPGSVLAQVGTLGPAAFDATAECRVLCKGQESYKLFSIDRRFHAQEQGLVRGNGEMWAPLTIALWDFASEICISGAQERCGSAGFQNLGVVRLKSGTGDKHWKMEAPPSCPSQDKKPSPDEKPTPDILSPFDPSSGAKVSASQEAGSVEANVWSQSFSSIAPLTEIDSKTLDTCKHRAKIQVCGGDCIQLKACNPKNNPKQTLCSPKPLSIDSKHFCWDQTLGDVKPRLKDLAPFEREQLCRMLYRRALKDADQPLSKCAAVRFTPDCSPLGVLTPKESVVEETSGASGVPGCCGH